MLLRKLSLNSEKYAVIPIADHWMNGEEQINYWYNNLKSALIQGDTNQILSRKKFYQDLSSIHLIYSVDHVQGAFRSAL